MTEAELIASAIEAEETIPYRELEEFAAKWREENE